MYWDLLVNALSHLVLYIYLGPTGEKHYYNVSMATGTCQHESCQTILGEKINKTVLTPVKLNAYGVHLLYSNPMRSLVTT